MSILSHLGGITEIGKHKTMITKFGNSIAVIFHSTVIVEIKKNDGVKNRSGSDLVPLTVKLDSGGYRTQTTKLRINQTSREYNLGFKVYQKQKNWYVELSTGQVYDFYDDMEIKTLGNWREI